MQVRLAILSLALVTTSSFAAEMLNSLAYVTRYKDGDTFVAQLNEGRTITVRLWGVDTPERGQPWGAEATKALAALATNPVSLECPRKDRDGRWTCRVWNNKGADINLTLVAQGNAWWEKRYAPKAIELRDAELDARELRVGLWQAENPISPWEWRRGKR